MPEAGSPSSEVRVSTLYYVHDPMCSWCWAFRPVWGKIRSQLPEGMAVVPLLGGLAADSEAPMEPAMRSKLQSTWRIIEERVPGTRFNHAFWSECAPRRATYPACRAVISARLQGEGLEERMIDAIQRAYYLEARNPSDDETLVALAAECGLDGEQFERALNNSETQHLLEVEIARSQALNIWSFPSLVVESEGGWWPIQYDYQDPGVTLGSIQHLLEPTVK